MATKDKTSATKKAPSETTITRISANDTKKSGKSVAQTTASSKKTKRARALNPLRATGDYFKGAWFELRQVRWPNRKATWGLTAAVLGFTAFFVLLILLLDALFKYLFQIILG